MWDFGGIGLFIAGLAIGTWGTWVYFRKRGCGADAEKAELGRLVADLRSQLSARAQAHETDIDRLRSEARQQVRKAEDRAYSEGEQRAMERLRDFTIHVRPYVTKKAEGSLIWKKQTLEVGSMYQLKIHGVPCFEPFYQRHELTEEIEADKDVLEAAKQVAIQGMRTFVAAQFGAHPGFLTIDESVVEQVAGPK